MVETPGGPARTSGSLIVASALACGVVLLLFDLPLLKGEVYVAHDLGSMYLPIRWFYQNAMASGDDFVWLPHWFNGIYVHGEGQSGLYHPLNLLLYRFVPLGPAFNLELLRSYLGLLAGTYFFLRRWSLSKEASLFGGLAATLSASSLHHYTMLSVMAGFAHLPLLLLAIDVIVRDERRGRVALGSLGLALTVGSLLHLGHPQMVFASALVSIAYAAMMLRARFAGRRALRILGAVVLGCGIGALQLLPMLDAMQHSIRDAALTGPASAVAFHPLDVVQFLDPYLFKRGVIASGALGAMTFRGDLRLYSGALAPVLLIWLWIQPRPSRTTLPLLIGTAIVALFMFILSTGRAGGLYSLQQALPLVGNLRTPARYGLVVDIAMAIMMAIGFESVLRTQRRHAAEPPPRTWPLLIAPAASAAIALSALVAVRFWRVPPLSSSAWLAAGPLLALMAAALVMAAVRRSRLALLAIVVFTAADLAFFSAGYLRDQPSSTIDTLLDPTERPSDYTFEHRILRGHASLIMKDVRLSTGLVAMIPKQFRILANRQGLKDPNYRDFLRISSVGWMSPKATKMTLDPLPRARLVGRVTASSDPLAELKTVDVEAVALVERPVDLEGGPIGKASILSDRPGEIGLQTEASTRQLLIISESHHAGWKATVDGEPTEVVPVYGHFIGVVVDAGHHTVELRFEPNSLRIGRRICGVSLALLALFGLLDLRASVAAGSTRSSR